MMLDYTHDYMNHMMDWSPNGWIILVVGGLIFFLFIVILIYFLSRKHPQGNLTKSLPPIANDNHIYSNIQTEDYQKIPSPKGIEDELFIPVNFCPNCGERLDARTTKYCPSCGSEI